MTHGSSLWPCLGYFVRRMNPSPTSPSTPARVSCCGPWWFRSSPWSALLAGDRELAKRIVDQDIEIDDLVNAVVTTTETRLLENSSMNVDERGRLLTLLRILPEVERNGDLAEHIARRAARGLGNEMSPRSRGLVERMGEVASTIWREATDVIIDGKLEAAGVIEDIDDELDDLHVSLTAELTSGSMTLPVAVELALLARFYERFGDHCVNLARRQVGRAGAD
jgi:phosphate transport system protein